MSEYFINKLVDNPNPMSVMFHRKWVSKIKKNLGSKCTFLQHMRNDKGYFLEARFKNNEGKHKITFKIEGTPSDVSNKNYLDLEAQLIDYARTKKFIR